MENNTKFLGFDKESVKKKDFVVEGMAKVEEEF
jgi:hypothetical protein